MMLCYSRSHSWLEFGAEKFQERMWSHFRSSLARRRSVLREKERGGCEVSSETGISDRNEVCPAVPVLLNPCIFKGHVEPMEFDYIDDGDEDIDVVLVEGTGDANECTKLIRSILWPAKISETGAGAEEEEARHGGSACTERGRCPIDSVHVPRIQDLHFYGMVR
jgi:hypothetical protein